MRDVIKLGNRFAKYSKEVSININVPEVLGDTSYRAKTLVKLLESKSPDFKNHIKYFERIYSEGTFTESEKAFLARIYLIKDKKYYYTLGGK